MARISANGLEFEYDETGPKEGMPVVLIMGFGAQMTAWPDIFRLGMAEAGFRVIRFDNRDAGLSVQFDDAPFPNIPALTEAVEARRDEAALAPYLLEDMAADAAAIIDGLGLGSAHIIGASMGGMIAQILALNHPENVRSLTAVMTTSGDWDLPPSEPEALAALIAPAASPAREDVINKALKTRSIIGSDPGLRDSDELLMQRAGAAYERAFRPIGVVRQYSAILAQPRWHTRLNALDLPTLVLHGAKDPLIKAACGRDIADRVPGARYHEIEKWGHDMPSQIIPGLIDEICALIKE